MLKKAGIVVATSAAALLAVSPLAFAGDYSDNDNGGGHHHSRSHHRHGGNCDQDNSADVKGGRHDDGGALLDVSRNVVQVPIQACNNNVVNNVVVGILSKNQRAESNNG